MLETLVRTFRNENVKSAIAVIIIVGIVAGFFFGLRFVLNTPVPVRVVESGSMCVDYDGSCNGWSHPFDQTLHVGDIIIIQGINPADLNTDYPNSDIIVYQNPTNPAATPIVHRIVKADKINGTLYFQTKGDGNEDRWPAVPPSSEYDSNTIYPGHGQGVPQNLVIGKVVLRIPWFGWITLIMRDNVWVLPAVILVIIVLVLLEFVAPILRRKQQAEGESPKPQA